MLLLFAAFQSINKRANLIGVLEDEEQITETSVVIDSLHAKITWNALAHGGHYLEELVK